MSLQFVSRGELKLYYETYGSGEECIIAFHGHTKDASDFAFLENENRKIISVHLFHHSHSYFPDDRVTKNPLKTDEWTDLIEKMLIIEKVIRFHLIGFSQGGRFALKTYEKFSPAVLSLSLLSPDGIDLDGYYSQSSKNAANLWFMNFLEKRPKLFRFSVSIAHKMGKVPSSVVDLVTDFSQSPEKMVRASKSWQNFRQIQTDPKVFGDLYHKNPIDIKIIMGKYDGIFPPQIAYTFLKNANIDLEPIIIESGHDFFKTEAKELFASQLPF